MSDINKAISLYEKMSSRCNQTGFSKRQAKVYAEMVEFMSDCETVEESMAKIKNSHYYLAPSAALVQDKLAALQKGAEENDMPEAAKVYADTIAKIDEDISEMYDSAYEVSAGNIKRQYYQTMDAFQEVYRNYLRICCCPADDDVEFSSAVADIKRAAEGFLRPSKDFRELADTEMMRNMIPVGDEAYAEFVRCAGICIEGDSGELKKESKSIEQETEVIMKELKAAKDGILSAGRENEKKTQRARVTVYAPDDIDGVYTYDGEVL